MDGTSNGQAAKATAGRWVAVLGCWFAAGCFLVAWWWPRALDDGRWVRFGVAVLVFEFLTIHATAILTFAVKRTDASGRRWIGLVAMYALMALAMALVFRSWILLLSFAALLAGRVRALYRPEDQATLMATNRRVAVSALLFLLLTFATVLIPMPAGGIDSALLAQVWPQRGGGLWERQPQQALALGFVYFLLLGLIEARPPGQRWNRLPTPAATGSGS